MWTLDILWLALSVGEVAAHHQIIMESIQRSQITSVGLQLWVIFKFYVMDIPLLAVASVKCLYIFSVIFNRHV